MPARHASLKLGRKTPQIKHRIVAIEQQQLASHLLVSRFVFAAWLKRCPNGAACSMKYPVASAKECQANTYSRAHSDIARPRTDIAAEVCLAKTRDQP